MKKTKTISHQRPDYRRNDGNYGHKMNVLNEENDDETGPPSSVASRPRPSDRPLRVLAVQ